MFRFCEPQAGWRHVEGTERHTLQDFAHQRKGLVEERYPEADVSRVVLDQLTTHQPASLSATFPPAEAHRLRHKLEFHYPPKHGSWLNMAEIELSECARQCLRRRIATETLRKRELAAVEAARHAARATLDRQFTTADARVKLHRLSPSTSLCQSTRLFLMRPKH